MGTNERSEEISASELAAIKEGREAYKRGDFSTLEELKQKPNLVLENPYGPLFVSELSNQEVSRERNNYYAIGSEKGYFVLVPKILGSEAAGAFLAEHICKGLNKYFEVNKPKNPNPNEPRG